MPDPTTSNILLNVPTRGSDSGTWDTPLNSNANSIDGRFGGVQTITVSGSAALSAPTGTASPGAGPTQAENMAIVFSGTLAAAATITLPLPGSYILRNNCLGSALIMRAAGTGNVVGLPPGEAVHVWNGGTHCEFANMGRVGEYMDLAVSTTPAWMTACTVLPYLPCDGTTYAMSSYTTLGLMLGSTFGGNGVTTFGTPDLRGRYRIPIDFSVAGSTSGRINATTAGAGFDGTVLGTSGGSQFLQSHTHTGTTGNPNTTPSFAIVNVQRSQNGGGEFTSSAGSNLDHTHNFTTAATGAGSSGNIPPGIVAGISFIKT